MEHPEGVVGPVEVEVEDEAFTAQQEAILNLDLLSQPQNYKTENQYTGCSLS